MSIESWKAEFYPVEAAEVSAEDALAHSLKKWQGLQEESLLKHSLVKCRDGISIRDQLNGKDTSYCFRCRWMSSSSSVNIE